MRTSLNRSLHGRAIVVSSAYPTPTYLHSMQPVTLGRANMNEVHLEVSNPGSGVVVVEFHYNNGAIYKSVPPLDTVPLDFTLEGDSTDCTVANAHLVAYLHPGSPSGAQVNVMGGVFIG